MSEVIYIFEIASFSHESLILILPSEKSLKYIVFF